MVKSVVYSMPTSVNLLVHDRCMLGVTHVVNVQWLSCPCYILLEFSYVFATIFSIACVLTMRCRMHHTIDNNPKNRIGNRSREP